MKVIIVLLFVTQAISSQTVREYLSDDYLKNHWKVMSLTFASGACDGMAETLKFHRSDFLEVHPNASQWWSNDWLAKYKNRDPEQGERYPLSTSVLIFPIDGYHAFKTSRNVFFIAAITINIGERKRPILYVVDFVNYTFCYSLGFTAIYDWIY